MDRRVDDDVRQLFQQELPGLPEPPLGTLVQDALRRRLVLEGSRAFGVGYLYANLLGNEAGRAIYDGDALVASDLSQLVAMLFVLAMLALIGSLGLFLREIYLGVNTITCPLR